MKVKMLLYLTILSTLRLSANTPEPTSALAYQQTTNSRIVVEENYLRFFTGDNERMMIDANGNVGIGLSSFVWGTELDKMVVKTGVLVADPDHAAFTYANSDTPGTWLFRSIARTAEETLTIESNFDGVKGVMTFDNQARIGIGTSVPLAKLDVRTSEQSGLMATYLSDQTISDGSEVHRWTIRTGRSYDYPNRTLDFGMVSTSHGQLPAFYVAPEGNEVFRITHLGNVGIGTSNAFKRLTIIDGNVFIGTSSFNQFESGRVRFSEYNSGSYQGAFIHYNGSSNVFSLGVHDANDNNSSNDSNAISILRSNSFVGIGTTYPSHKLHVVGNTHSSTYSADSPPTWPDYVFEDSYELTEIEAVEKYIEKNNHLPEIPSAAEVKENGVDIIGMQAKLLQKIEELTLYVIEQQKEINELKKIINKTQ